MKLKPRSGECLIFFSLFTSLFFIICLAFISVMKYWTNYWVEAYCGTRYRGGGPEII